MKVSDVVVDYSIYPRAKPLEKTVDEYVDALNGGAVFPPIVLEPKTNRLLDGMHRLLANKKLEREDIDVTFKEVPEGIPARLFALSLSVKHGDRPTYEDRKAVARKTYEENPKFNLEYMAEYTGVHRDTVSKWLHDLTEAKRIEEEKNREIRKIKACLLKEAGWSNVKIAKELLGAESKESTIRNDVGPDTAARRWSTFLDQVPEDQLWKVGYDLLKSVDIDIKAIITKIITRRLEPITTAFAVPISKARITARETYELAERYKTFSAKQEDRVPIAKDMMWLSQYYITIAQMIEDPTYGSVTEEDIRSIQEG